jgi:hypothetical protein
MRKLVSGGLVAVALMVGGLVGAHPASATSKEGCTVVRGRCSYVATEVGSISAIGHWSITITRAGRDYYVDGRGDFDVRRLRDVIRPGDRVTVVVPNFICLVFIPSLVRVGPAL